MADKNEILFNLLKTEVLVFYSPKNVSAISDSDVIVGKGFRREVLTFPI